MYKEKRLIRRPEDAFNYRGGVLPRLFFVRKGSRMSRVAAFVDAGYFWVQCSQILFNDKRARGDILLDPVRMREKLLEVIRREFPRSSLLRIYWYDGLGTDGSPTDMHRRIHELDDFKVRYGTRNQEGKQKGIDGLLMADLIGLAQNRGITDALILSGDGDLTPGVAAAQTLGVRVHRLEMGGPDASSPSLRAEVDRNALWARSEVESFLRPNPSHPDAVEAGEDAMAAVKANARELEAYPDFGGDPVPAAGAAQDSGARREESEALLRNVARQFSRDMRDEGTADMIFVLPAIPSEIDKRLLFAARTALGRKLLPEEKVALRASLKNSLRGEEELPVGSFVSRAE